MPLFGVFVSEFLILTTPMREHPWATISLLIALSIAFAEIFCEVQPWSLVNGTRRLCRNFRRLVPVFVHLPMVLALGVVHVSRAR